MFLRFVIQKKFELTAILIFLLSLFLSIYFSLFNFDHHHPQIMFVRAKQLLSGLTPYKEILMLYGPLTTLINAFAINLFGEKILSVFIINSLFYGLTFPVFFAILKNLEINKITAILSIFLLFLIHPSIALPWPNYYAYFFLILGIYNLTKKNIFKYNFFLAGLFWSLACLSRQTFIVPLFLSIVLIVVFEFCVEKKKDYKKYIVSLLSGFFIPIFIFLSYLFLNNIFTYWTSITFDISGSYLPELRNPNDIKIFNYFYYTYNLLSPLLSNLFLSIKNLDPRFFFYLLIFTFNIFAFIFFFKKRYNIKVFYLTFVSLFLCSENIHLVEIFRMSTGLALGFIPLIFFLGKKKIFRYFLYLFIFILIFTWQGGKHNYTYEYHYKFSSDKVYSKSGYFNFQKFPKNVANFYEEFENVIDDVHSNYTVANHYNHSATPILGLMSKTSKYLVESYYDERFNKLYSNRLDVDLNNVLKNSNDFIIFYAANDENVLLKFKKNFFIYKKIKYPFDNLKYLFILLPKKVAIKS